MIDFHKLRMAIIDLEIAARTYRTYSEEKSDYVVDGKALEEPFNKLVKIINEGKGE